MKSILALLGLSIFGVMSLHADSVPDDLRLTRFAGPDVAPCPACLCVSASGDVYAGVDLNGSLGKGPGKGRIVKLVDADKDGVADSHSVFAEIDNPRGLLSVGTKLYVLYTAFGPDDLSTGMNLAVLEDANRDGIADGPVKILIEGICSADAINQRGTDHSTNGIRLGIDGWIYIAVGDFGFADATGRDGTILTLLGGGVVRVRPDGTELELYTTGTRNIYDVAIDPFLNVFTRGNTNDGGGWNVRFLHHVQSGAYGYPRLFQNFADEIIPALEDVGGGSGVGALFLSEPTWPSKYNDEPLMADWGRQAVYLHRLRSDGPTFRQKAEEFVRISQVTDLDVDPAGQLFLSAWDGAGFKGDESKGYLVRVTPENWRYQTFPNLRELSLREVAEILVSPSATARLHAQQEILRRPARASAGSALIDHIRDGQLPAEARAAALYTYAQLDVEPDDLLAFAEDEVLREFALRAATDRLPRLETADLPLQPFVAALREGTPRQQAAAAIALGRLGNPEAAEALLAVPYTKPKPEGKPTATQLDTLKGKRSSKISLDVRPDQKLYLNLAETNPVETVSHLALHDPVFVRADRSKVSLTRFSPVSGTVWIDENPDGSAPAPAGNKKRKPKHFVTARAGSTIVYRVPDQAIRFESKVTTASSNPKGGSIDFFASIMPPGQSFPSEPVTPRHATPNPDVILPHLAMQSLVRLRVVEPCLAGLGTPAEDLALWALASLHEEAAVSGLLAKLSSTRRDKPRRKILTALARLYHEEAPYDGSWWWSTRPETRGPDYKPVAWAASERIARALEAEVESADAAARSFLADLNASHRLGLEKLGTNLIAEEIPEQPTVDLAEIASKQGAVGSTPIEDIILSLDELAGDPELGKDLFIRQGCAACHARSTDGPVLGPYMGQVGSIMNREQIATAILRPNDTISQGFPTTQLTLADGSLHVGFVTERNAERIVLRNMTGQVTTLAAADVVKEAHLPVSMMPPGLANALSLEDFASLVAYLASQK